MKLKQFKEAAKYLADNDKEETSIIIVCEKTEDWWYETSIYQNWVAVGEMCYAQKLINKVIDNAIDAVIDW